MITRILAGLVILSSLAGQDKAPQSVWDGIYTVDQATKGEAAFAEACASCHGDKLEGQGQAPALAGSDFAANWNGSSVGELLERIQISMPADRPGQLSKDKNASILAYIFKFNKYPSGSKDLPESADSLKSVRIEPKPAAK